MSHNISCLGRNFKMLFFFSFSWKPALSAGKVNLSPVGITFGVLSILSACCGCLKYCCCGSSSSQKEEEEEEGSPENEPVVQYNEASLFPMKATGRLHERARGWNCQSPGFPCVIFFCSCVKIKLQCDKSDDPAPPYDSLQHSSNETGPLVSVSPFQRKWLVSAPSFPTEF